MVREKEVYNSILVSVLVGNLCFEDYALALAEMGGWIRMGGEFL
jgi:hypothetical protein